MKYLQLIFPPYILCIQYYSSCGARLTLFSQSDGEHVFSLLLCYLFQMEKRAGDKDSATFYLAKALTWAETQRHEGGIDTQTFNAEESWSHRLQHGTYGYIPCGSMLG